MIKPYERESWASRLGFVLAAAGSAVGLGNIWRFPYLTGENGGAAFLLIYLVCILVIGYPVMVNEIVLGRKTHRNPVGAFRELAPNTPWWLVGALGVLAGFTILSFYSVVAGWSLSYIYKTVVGVLTPGTDFEGLFVGHITSLWEPIFWHALFMGITIAVVAAGIRKGIQRTVEVLMPILLVLLIVLIARAVTLPGAGAGLAFFLAPDFSEITWRTLLAAVGQAFFTLSLGMGALITYGSYLRDDDEIPGSGASIVGLDTLIAVLAGFAIFPAVFALGFDPAAGPGLTFITLPAVFAEMSGGVFFGFVFFTLLSIAAITSAISLLEVVVAWIVDQHHWPRARAAVTMGGLIFLLGLPATLGYNVLSDITFMGMDILDTYDWVSGNIMLPLGGLLSAVFVGYIWGTKNAQEEANQGAFGFKIGPWWGFLIRYIVPIAIAIVMFFGIYDTIIQFLGAN